MTAAPCDCIRGVERGTMTPRHPRLPLRQWTRRKRTRFRGGGIGKVQFCRRTKILSLTASRFFFLIFKAPRSHRHTERERAWITTSNNEDKKCSCPPSRTRYADEWGRSCPFERDKFTQLDLELRESSEEGKGEGEEKGRGHASQGALNSAKRLLKRLEKIYVGHAGK